MNVRTQAYAAEAASIEASQGRAIAAREAEQSRPRNALEALAGRLQVSPGGLKKTLMQTVFSACRSEEEFIALTIVANTYDLNPLTKEIYAFPKKGGGIQPMIGYDGWVKIMNNHPQFDGIEYNHTIDDKGNIVAVEGVIYRKDRSRPIKKIVYLKEFKKGTEPWNNSPAHMLDVRCLCHTVRLAFGVSAGIEGDDEGITVDGGHLESQSLPSRRSLAEELGDEIPTFDNQTGEVRDEAPRNAAGMTEVGEDEARALDAAQTLNDIDGPLDQGEPDAEPQHDDKPAWWAKVQWIKDATAKARNKQQLKDADDEFTRIRAGLPDDVITELETLINQRRNALSQPKEG